jgi:hypothetical protein
MSMSRWNDGSDRGAGPAAAADDDDDDDDDDDEAVESSEGLVSLKAMQVLCRWTR